MIPKRKEDIIELTTFESFVFGELPEETATDGLPYQIGFSDYIKILQSLLPNTTFQEIVSTIKSLKDKGWVTEKSYYRRNVYFLDDK